MAIPIALHLLGRREPKRVLFPAVRFLTQRLETNRRKLQVRRWVLLTMRLALVALFAIALAQPQIHRAMVATWLGVAGLGALGLLLVGLGMWGMTVGIEAKLRNGLIVLGAIVLLLAGGWGTKILASGPRPIAPTTAPAAVVLLIDNVPTLSMLDTDGQSNLDKAKEMANFILSRYPLESRLSLLDRSARPAAFALDSSAIQRGLSAMDIEQSPRPMKERIDAAIRLLRTSDLPRKTLFVVSDITSSSWGESNEAMENSLLPLLQESPAVTIQIVDIGAEQYQNQLLDQIKIADATPPRDLSAIVSVAVREETSDKIATNGEAERPVTVQMRLFENVAGLPAERDGVVVMPDSRAVDRKTLSLTSGAAIAELVLPPLSIGTHHGVIELSTADSIAIDNSRYFTVRVGEPRRVLIVSDQPDDQHVLASILNPYGDDDPRGEYEVDQATLAQLRDLDLSLYKTIGLFDPALAPPALQDKLETWVRRGGRLFVALGPSLENENALAAVKWELIGNPLRVWRIPDNGTFFQVVSATHPTLNILTTIPGGAPWNAFRVRHYWQLSDSGNFNELMRYAGTEHLAMGERIVGEGRVLIFTTPVPAQVAPAIQWNDLFKFSTSNAWELYIVFVREIFEDLSGGHEASMNVAVGESLALSVPAGGSTRYQLFAPDLAPVPLDAAGSMIVPGAPLTVGNYWLRGAAGDQLGFSANLPTLATQLARVQPEFLDRLFGIDQYRLVHGIDEIQMAEGEASDSRPLYSFVMLAAAILFALEQILSNRFYASSSASNRIAGGKRASGASVAAS